MRGQATRSAARFRETTVPEIARPDRSAFDTASKPATSNITEFSLIAKWPPASHALRTASSAK